MCDNGYLMMLMMNSAEAKAKSNAYNSKPLSYGRQYAVTPTIFSRMLGINYVSAGLNTPINSYLAKTKDCMTMAYQKYVKSITKEIESRRELLMKTIDRERDISYLGNNLRYA